jgi:hypothetical protein
MHLSEHRKTHCAGKRAIRADFEDRETVTYYAYCRNVFLLREAV